MKKMLIYAVWLACLTVFDWLPALGQGLPWPINPTNSIKRLFAGYGTFDDYTPAGTGVHLHEGLDILVNKGTHVVASEAGKVVYAQINAGYANGVFVSRGNNTDEALCYVHITVSNNRAKGQPWAVNDAVKVGDTIGTVLQNGTIPAHLHFDWRRKEPAEPWTHFMTPWTPNNPPVSDYLPEFNGNPIDLLTPLVDQATNKPTFSSPIHYKLQGGNYFTTTIQSRDTVINGNVDMVARIAETFGPAGTTSYNIGPKRVEWTIDEYKPGTAAKIAKQTPINFSGRFLQAEPSINYTGVQRPNIGVPTFFNIAIPAAAGAGRNMHWKFYKNHSEPRPGGSFEAIFGDLIYTLYSNDATSRSVPRKITPQSPESVYWYFLTNIDNDNDVESTDAEYYWDTNGKEGQAWNDKDDRAANEADSNKNAAFPDGRYIFSLTAQGYGDATDVASRKDTVSVNNFDEFIYSCDAAGNLQDTFCVNTPVYIKGVGFPKNRSFRVFVIKDRNWAEGNNIPNDATRVAAATVTSDANGHIKPVAIWNAYTPNGTPDKGYDIVLDYNWDSLYSTPKLNKTVDVLDDKPLPFSIIGKALKVQKSKTDVKCYGECTGTITLTVSGGTPPYTFFWRDDDNSTTNPVRTGLCAGNYSVLVRDATGCDIWVDTTITEPAAKLKAACSADSSTCGQCNGKVTITATGGTAPYTYSWPGGTLTNLCAGTYTGTVTDANGCKDSCTVTVYDKPSTLAASCSGTYAHCGQCDGAATMTASGGTAPYTYSWPGGSLSNLCPGTYTGTVTDANGCTDSCTVTIYEEPNTLRAYCSSTITQCGQCDGSITITASGGTAPYYYSWPGGTLSGLCAGTYTGSVTDANGCTASCTATVYEQPSSLSLSCSSTYARCGQCDGSATLTASGGTAPYTYSWPGGSLSNLCAGTYTGSVTDANGCTASCTVTVYEQSSSLSLSCSSTNANCGECNGSATLTASGGTGPYTYGWPGGSLSNLCAGTYTGTVTDANGCTASCSVTVYDASDLSVFCMGTDATCDSCNGTASMFAMGGTAPYTYSWPGGSLNNLCAGSYFGTVTDANGCTASCGITIASMLSRICDTIKVDTIRHDTIVFDTDQVARPLQPMGKMKSKHLQDIKVFPNPFDTWVNIRFYSDMASRAHITVQSATGTIVQQFTTSAAKGYNTAAIDGKRLSSGTYFVKITVGSTAVVKIYRR